MLFYLVIFHEVHTSLKEIEVSSDSLSTNGV